MLRSFRFVVLGLSRVEIAELNYFLCLQPPTLTEKIKEVFGVSEVPNPESNNLGPNEVRHPARVCT